MIEARVDLTDPVKAMAFVKWARTNKIKYSVIGDSYFVTARFNNVFEVVRWI